MMDRPALVALGTLIVAGLGGFGCEPARARGGSAEPAPPATPPAPATWP
jgi:hypothetical protein